MDDRETHFGPFVLDRERQLLLRSGEAITISHRAYLILEALLEANGEVLSKAELLERAWKGLVVEEANLAVQIGMLRKAIGDEGNALILTVPRVGYRLARPQPAAEARHIGREVATIAVMPFANMSDSADQEYFADGIVDELITALSRFKTFGVTSRTSSFVFKGKSIDIRKAALELGVRYVLEGSVRRAGSRLRVTAQLVDAETGAHLWAEKFEGAAEDVFAFQDSITDNVVGLVEPTIRRAEIERARRKPPGSLAAYELFLQAIPSVYGMVPANYTTAIALLERAIEIDPDFAPALAFAAWAYEKHLSLSSDPTVKMSDTERCLVLAKQALSAGAEDPMILGICGFIAALVESDMPRGLSALRNSLAANPNNLVVLNLAGYANAGGGDLAEARRCFSRVLEISPGSPDAFQCQTGLAMIEVVEGNFEQAVARCQQSLATFNEWPFTYVTLAAAYAYLGRDQEARWTVDRILELAPGLTISALLTRPANRVPGRWPRVVEGVRRAGLPES